MLRARALIRAVGRAILYYERALMLNPDMGDARYNLDIAYALTDAPEAVPVGFMTDLWRSMSGAARLKYVDYRLVGDVWCDPRVGACIPTGK